MSQSTPPVASRIALPKRLTSSRLGSPCVAGEPVVAAVDDRVRAEAAAEIGLVLARDDRDRVRAVEPAELDRHRAEPAAGAPHEHVVPGLEGCLVDEHAVGREVDEAVRRGLGPGQVLRASAAAAAPARGSSRRTSPSWTRRPRSSAASRPSGRARCTPGTRRSSDCSARRPRRRPSSASRRARPPRRCRRRPSRRCGSRRRCSGRPRRAGRGRPRRCCSSRPPPSPARRPRRARAAGVSTVSRRIASRGSPRRSGRITHARMLAGTSVIARSYSSAGPLRRAAGSTQPAAAVARLRGECPVITSWPQAASMPRPRETR